MELIPAFTILIKLINFKKMKRDRYYSLILGIFVFLSNIFGILFFSSLFSIELNRFYPMLICLGFGLFGCLFFVANTHKLRAILPFIYAIFIFMLSNNSFKDVKDIKGGDYFHPLEFFSLGILLGCCFLRKEERNFISFSLKLFFIGFVYGILDELHQYFIPNRCSSISDVMFDSIGLFLSLIFLYPFFKNIKGKIYD